MSFNQKYEQYVNELPKYILDKIRKKILLKYKMYDENEYIDQIFGQYSASYKKKREYDIKFYKEHQGNHKEQTQKLRNEINKLQQENKEFRDHITNFIEYHKQNDLPPIRKTKK